MYEHAAPAEIDKNPSVPRKTKKAIKTAAPNGERTSIPRKAFSIDEAAAAIGVSRSMIKNEIARGHLKATKLGTRVLITAAELDRLLAAD
jgi:excisionase family DNA binding protein